MSPFRSILCPIDFSEESTNALRYSAALATRFKSGVIVLHAVEPLLEHAARARYGIDLVASETEPALREFVATALPHASNIEKLAIDVRVGDASTVILETADRQGADLIVMGTHGLGGFHKLVLGSTTERVLRQTRVSVLAVPGSTPSVVSDSSGAQFNIKSILAATDFSQASGDALHLAAQLAAIISVPLIVIHVVTPVTVPTRWQPYVDVADDERVKRERERLGVWLRDLQIQVPPEVVITVGRPAEAIARTADEKRAGLIVMGLYAGTAAFTPRPGSIAYRVVSTASVPALVVPPRTNR